jgi:hypothetical protein
MAALAGGVTGTGILQTVTGPAAYPDFDWLYVDTIDVEGIGVMSEGPNGMVAYEYARLTVEYKSLDVDFSASGIGAIQIDVAGDVLSIPQDQPTFKWSSDDEDVPPEASPSLSIATATILVPQKNLPKLENGTLTNIIALMDHVNNSVLFGAPVGKMLYKGATSYGKVMSSIDNIPGGGSPGAAAGLEATDLVHKLLFRSIEWNKFLRPSTGTWDSIVYKATGDPYFPSGSLNSIFGV